VEKVYLDTSVFSAYFDSRDSVRQKTTQDFWHRLEAYEKYASELVLDELGKMGNEAIRKNVLKLTEGFGVLRVTDDVKKLAWKYVEKSVFPNKYFSDALHLALATIARINIVISWNFEHFVKRKTRILANTVNLELKYGQVEIIAPPEL